MLHATSKFKHALPKSVDCVIIGGGVIGTFTSLYLNRYHGVKTLLLEKGRIAGEQSSRNWGWVRCMNRDPHELPIAMESQYLWKEVDKQVNGETGYTNKGIHYLCSTEEKMESWNYWIDIAKEHGLDSHFINAKEVEEYFPHVRKGLYVGALTTPSDGRAEPWTAVPAVAKLAEQEGVIIREECAVRGLCDVNGTIKGVATEDGIVECEQVVLAGGAWSSMMASRHGIFLPQLLVKGTVGLLEETNEIVTSGQIKDEKLAVRRRRNGGYTLALPNTIHHFSLDSFMQAPYWLPLLKTLPDVSLRPPSNHIIHPSNYDFKKWTNEDISPFEKERILNPSPDIHTIQKLEHLFYERFPNITQKDDHRLPRITTSWAGMIDAMPDVVPVVDRVKELEGLVIATGMSAHGFGIGPGFGKAVANIVVGKDVGHDMSRFRSNRFTDGSVIQPGPGL
jgi:glycine/D-amino acid oxidase-like deaminating enzyme